MSLSDNVYQASLKRFSVAVLPNICTCQYIFTYNAKSERFSLRFLDLLSETRRSADLRPKFWAKEVYSNRNAGCQTTRHYSVKKWLLWQDFRAGRVIHLVGKGS